MGTQEVLSNIETAINRICKDIIKKKGSTGGDKLDSLSKLVNSYSRLLERGQNVTQEKNDEEGDPDYYRSHSQQTLERRGLIR
ncbi:MAG TPA: hypothetical protein PK528_12405 [Syntrophorhabdus sp.]|nr:hypothetical protein [Syntrophorhabdus sp.]